LWERFAGRQIPLELKRLAFVPGKQFVNHNGTIVSVMRRVLQLGAAMSQA
jgi:hypothetical protein